MVHERTRNVKLKKFNENRHENIHQNKSPMNIAMGTKAQRNGPLDKRPMKRPIRTKLFVSLMVGN